VANGAGLAENLLRESERRDDLVILGGAGREDAEDGELAAGDIECVAGLLAKFCRQALADEDVLRVVIRPAARRWRVFDSPWTGESPVPTRDFPPRMRDPYSGGEILLAEVERLIEVGADQRDIFGSAAAAEFHGDGQHGREADNVVVPEGAANFRKIGFVEERAVTRGLQVDATDFHVECVLLRSDDQVRAVATQFAVDFVADVGRYGDHSGGDRNAKRDRDARE